MVKVYKNIINERIEKYGISTLTDEETLCILTGIPIPEIKNSLENYGLFELVKFSSSIPLTKPQRRKLELIYHMAKRISLSDYKEKTNLNCSSKAGEYFKKELQFLSYEVFKIALLDSQNRIIKTEIVSKGTINEAPVYPREIVKIVLNSNANSVILAHNHPGGSKSPSSADIEVTRKIVQALKTISVSVIDHIIIADNTFISFAENGLLNV